MPGRPAAEKRRPFWQVLVSENELGDQVFAEIQATSLWEWEGGFRALDLCRLVSELGATLVGGRRAMS